MSQGCALLILRSKGQRSRSWRMVIFWKWFPDDNWLCNQPMIMKLHNLTHHESRMCPIDFGVKRSTVKVMAHGYLKMVHRNNGCRFEFVGVGGGPVLLQQYFQYAFICCPYMLPLLLHRWFHFRTVYLMKDGKAVNYNGSEIIGLINLKYGKRTACRDNLCNKCLKNPKILITSKFKRLGLTGNLGKPIWVVYSDGGPDHWVRFTSVKLGLIAIFLLDDCDHLLAVRTAPHQSYRNWVEMIISILNLALQTVAICRSTISADMEHILKSLSIMEAIIRKTALGNEFQRWIDGQFSLPEKLFYPVVHGTISMLIFTSPVNILVVLQRFRFFFKIFI